MLFSFFNFMRRQHITIYVAEFFLISLGFAFLLTSQLTFYNQMAVMLFILSLYVVIGLLHHNKHHDITLKVVLEYILISALLFALFVFLNITKI